MMILVFRISVVFFLACLFCSYEAFAEQKKVTPTYIKQCAIEYHHTLHFICVCIVLNWDYYMRKRALKLILVVSCYNVYNGILETLFPNRVERDRLFAKV